MLVELVTVGPGSDDLSLYGHSAVCIGADSSIGSARCYDFGVPGRASDPSDLAWDTIRGRPRFVPVAVDRSLLVESFVALERTVQVQVLPLDDGQAAALRGSLEAAVATQEPYWYRPWFDNCTTRLRDAIDAATGGKLHAGADVPSPGPTFRELSEQGLSGHVPELAGLALFLGGRADRVPTVWERMFLPAGLRDAVQQRLGVTPKTEHAPEQAAIASSTAAGRAGLVLVGLVLAGAILAAKRLAPRAVPFVVGVVGAVLGLVAVAVDVVPFVTRFAELGHNAVALVLWPTDVAIGGMPAGWRERYLVARLAVLGIVAVSSALGIVGQPVVAACVLAALPLGAMICVRGARVTGG